MKRIWNIISYLSMFVFFSYVGFYSTFLSGTKIMTVIWMGAAGFGWFIGYHASDELLNKLKAEKVKLDYLRHGFRVFFFMCTWATLTSIAGLFMLYTIRATFMR